MKQSKLVDESLIKKGSERVKKDFHLDFSEFIHWYGNSLNDFHFNPSKVPQTLSTHIHTQNIFATCLFCCLFASLTFECLTSTWFSWRRDLEDMRDAFGGNETWSPSSLMYPSVSSAMRCCDPNQIAITSRNHQLSVLLIFPCHIPSCKVLPLPPPQYWRVQPLSCCERLLCTLTASYSPAASNEIVGIVVYVLIMSNIFSSSPRRLCIDALCLHSAASRMWFSEFSLLLFALCLTVNV